MKEHGIFRKLATPGRGASHSPTHSICLTASPHPPPPCLRQPSPLHLITLFIVQSDMHNFLPVHSVNSKLHNSATPYQRVGRVLQAKNPLPLFFKTPDHCPDTPQVHFSATTRWSRFIQFFCDCQTPILDSN